MSSWTAEWTGKYPCLCSGEWILYRDDEPVDTDIPFQSECAGTYRTYSRWYFDDNYSEHWEEYEDGLDADAWIDEHWDWLQTLTDDEDEYHDIFFAFQDKDWRSSSCGGCI